jgi:lysyl-tRNA synthetase class 1
MRQPAEKQKMGDEIPSAHWADHAADELVQRHASKAQLVCASGISPSGVVHIGNFREVITVDFVVRALRDRGRKVRFIYSWDDYDALRKVPANLPKAEMIEQNLRRPISKIPDPFGQCASYAAYFEKRFEEEITQLGVSPEYIRQNEPYRAGKYADGILEARRNEKTIVEILNRARTEPLPAGWSCVSIYCKECGRDTTEVTGFREPSTFTYRCKACKKDFAVDCRTEEGVKLLWRVDWPMRWARETVDFEPGGKDHSSQGGSYDTGAEIIRAVWKTEPPYYVQYDFVLAKGLGSKLSSSSGNLLTLGETLEVYEPAVIRWIFASRKPNLDFSIAFDLDVMKAYDEFDRTERYAYGVEPGDPKKVNYERRIYELSVVEHQVPRKYGPMPAQFGFRHLCNILQIHQGDLEKAKAFFAGSIKGAGDEARFYSRAKRAWKWIAAYAPDEFKFSLKTDAPGKTKYPAAVKALVSLLREEKTLSTPEEQLASAVYEIIKGNGIEPKAFFQETYQILVGKSNGPKLASFLLAIGPRRAAELLERAV